VRSNVDSKVIRAHCHYPPSPPKIADPGIQRLNTSDHDSGYQRQNLHQYTATKSFSLRRRSSCLAVTSSITGSASLCLPAEPRDEASSSAFVLAAATWLRRVDAIKASTVRRTNILGWPVVVVVVVVVGIVGPRAVVLRLLLRQHHHHRPNCTAELSFAVDIAALTATHWLGYFWFFQLRLHLRLRCRENDHGDDHGALKPTMTTSLPIIPPCASRLALRSSDNLMENRSCHVALV